MIIAKAPLRITLGGGGTDLSPYADTHDACCVAAAINKYVYVIATRPFQKGIYLKYSIEEKVQRVEDVQHPLIREALTAFRINNIELTTLADIPSGTGLGSSGAFLVALVAALEAYSGWSGADGVAKLAFDLERRVALTGFQDHVIAQHGGCRRIHAVDVSTPVNYPVHRLRLFWTGVFHQASAVLAPQVDTPATHWDQVYQAGCDVVQRLAGHRTLGEAFNHQWALKEARSPSVPEVVALRNRALPYCTGVKLIGAGGGGFLLCEPYESQDLIEAMPEGSHVPFHFSPQGVTVTAL